MYENWYKLNKALFRGVKTRLRPLNGGTVILQLSRWIFSHKETL